MKRTHVTEQTIDPAIGRRIFTGCWFCAGLGVSILQMLLLAQAWLVSRQALVPACMASAWVLGSLLGMRLRATARLWGGCLIACTLLWLLGTRLVSWRSAHCPDSVAERRCADSPSRCSWELAARHGLCSNDPGQPLLSVLPWHEG